jgi:nitroreductase
MEINMEKPAETNHEIHELLRSRWSPRAYSPQPIEEEKLWSLFEAARWSASGGNRQPWAFILVSRSDYEMHEKLVALLSGRNKLWAKDAPVLILAVAKLNPQADNHRFTYYDVGQAVAHLSIQASALGLYTHQMAGFDAEKARQLFQLPDDVEPMTLTAVGYLGNAESLPDDLRERELAPRTRNPLADFVFHESWGRPLHLNHHKPVLKRSAFA